MRTFLRVFGGVIAALWCVVVLADLGVATASLSLTQTFTAVQTFAPASGNVEAQFQPASANGGYILLLSSAAANRGFIGIGPNTCTGIGTSDACFAPGSAGNFVVGTAAGAGKNVSFGPSGGMSSVGTTFTLGSGTGACTSTSTLTGGYQAGSFLCTGTAGASTQPIVLPTAPNGWACSASDVTSGVAWAQSATSTTGCTISGTLTTTSDKVVFHALGY